MHQIQCQCGSLKGSINVKGTTSRIRCFCADCRAFNLYLDCESKTIDSHGGTEVIHVAQPYVNITEGVEQLAAIRLSPKGMVRCYAKCCNTPFGSLLAKQNMSFISMASIMLDEEKIDVDFGRKVAFANAQSAIGEHQSEVKNHGVAAVVVRLIKIIISMRFSKRYKESIFFNEAGELAVEPKILSKEESIALKEQSRRG